MDGVEDDDAHPQYLLKAGDTLTGDILLGEGVTIDGIVPSTHTHTEDDGTPHLTGAS